MVLNWQNKGTVVPSFPKTPHLPHKPKLGSGDTIASDTSSIFSSTISVEEKIDGASVGIAIGRSGDPIIRNRDNILSKGYMRRPKDSSAKMQFRPIWNWFYDNQEKFWAVTEQGEYTIYGEWMIAQHGLYYDRLPDLFIPYDILDRSVKKFLDPNVSKKILTEAGFHYPRQYFYGVFENGSMEQLEAWANEISPWTNGEKAEGIYIKVTSGGYITHRFKMVREDFVQGALWNHKEFKKNDVAKAS